jgi:hypothetical protein
MPFNFKKKIADLKKLKKDLPKVIGNMAKRHYVESFRKGGFTDVSFNPWQARKFKDRSDRSRVNSTKSRAILVKTGHLRNSIRVRVATFERIEIGAYGVPYGVFHNNGEGKLPKRQFIGRSRSLNNRIRQRLNQEIKKIL